MCRENEAFRAPTHFLLGIQQFSLCRYDRQQGMRIYRCTPTSVESQVMVHYNFLKILWSQSCKGFSKCLCRNPGHSASRWENNQQKKRQQKTGGKKRHCWSWMKGNGPGWCLLHRHTPSHTLKHAYRCMHFMCTDKHECNAHIHMP